LEHSLRTLFAKPAAAAIFLFVNGFILIAAEVLTKNNLSTNSKDKNVDVTTGQSENMILAKQLNPRKAIFVGVAQTLSLFAGISRFGVTMSAGLLNKLSHRVAADFAFLAATPIILAAALYKVPDLLNSQYHQIRVPALVGGIAALIATVISTKFLVKWFKTRTLYPFAIYCLIVGLASIIKFG
jgi:undecaprenyl-diphosphatase